VQSERVRTDDEEPHLSVGERSQQIEKDLVHRATALQAPTVPG
jgi:hypothetical protein